MVITHNRHSHSQGIKCDDKDLSHPTETHSVSYYGRSHNLGTTFDVDIISVIILIKDLNAGLVYSARWYNDDFHKDAMII